MNKTILCFAVAIAAVTTFAAPRPLRPPVPRPHPAPHFGPRVVHHVPHHHCRWSPDPAWASSVLISGAVGGLLGAMTYETFVQPRPVVQPQTVIVAPNVQKVWVPGHYNDQVQPNGTIIKVWQPGFWQYITQ